MKIEASGLFKAFGSLEVLSGVSFVVEGRQILAIVGPSGCGKTTLLNLIASLDKQDSGTIRIPVTTKIAYMMQDSLLLPWRTLVENALLGTEIVNGKNPKNMALVNYYFESFDLAEHEHSLPDASSAGMKQRVALIRSLLIMPSLLLLDEPFSNLDFDIKLKVQRHLIDYHRKNHVTILLVTHDIEDAIALSNKVIVLSDKPSKVKAEIEIDLGITATDPVEARKSPKFREYFIQIWDELKYLDANE